MLELALHNKWLNPQELDDTGSPKFKDEKEFYWAYAQAFQRAMAFKEIINIIENADKLIPQLRKAIKSPDKNYEL